MNKITILLVYSIAAFSQNIDLKKVSKWQKQAQQVSISRDQWGIPHVEGKTDADAVFGLMYAQCEDDFERVELNYLEKLGRLSEVYGEKNLYNDLQIKLLINENEAKEEYKKAEPWLKSLLNAHADGINYFLYKNPSIQPKILKKFEPWYALLWTDGSIGAISTADLTINDLEMFYGNKEKIGRVILSEDYQQTGSNGFAIAPQMTSSKHAMLYINPHTTFYFRPEVHVKSNEGLNTYGAVTWGQFFVYQGFNEYCGWMHTSSNADVSDTYIEQIEKVNNKMFYKYEGNLRPLITKNITIKYLKNGILNSKTFQTYATHHGPIMAKRDNNWISLKSYNRAKMSLVQSWKRTKAKGFEDYKKVMALKANTSNNTVFADKFGNIAYWHGNYMPIRDNKLNWAKPQDGTIKETEYKGLHSIEEVVHNYNPENGWIQNCNSTPFTVSGKFSPKKSAFPDYMAPDGENFRGVNANRLLENATGLDLDKLIQLGYDNYLPAFAVLIPSLNKIQTPEKELSEALGILKNWDYRTTKESVATTLAIEWGQHLSPAIRKIYVDQGESDQISNTKKFAIEATEEELLNPLKEVLQTLTKNFGTWKVKWGDLNRYQRLNNHIPSEFDDNAESLPMGNASALWGCLPSFNSMHFDNSKKRYGYSGNSFVCAVEFGDKVKAKSLLAGGNSSDVNSSNFNDQAEMFTNGEFKEVLFYKEDIEKNTVRKYNPGE